ncbi:MAG TPA: N-acetyltransferase [Verrucomicrobiae bacterium]|nr:N-acetyltransferase [Verrucomicrobiae bacterium]
MARRISRVQSLRKYRPQDFQRLLEIDHSCFVSGIAYTDEELAYFLERPLGVALVGEEAGEINGFVITNRFRSRRAGSWIGHIITIDVAQEARRTGLGSQLLSTVEDELKAAGCDHVWLEVAVDNDPALEFYKKHGYTVLKTLPRYYLDSIDGFLMGKRLT